MSLVKPDVEKEIYWINKDKTRFYYDKYNLVEIAYLKMKKLDTRYIFNV
jgi:hypothetical protein